MAREGFQQGQVAGRKGSDIAEPARDEQQTLDPALGATARAAGLVVAFSPPDLAEVMAVAARGVRMPRKSTSFSPKPRMGVVMRDLRDA